MKFFNAFKSKSFNESFELNEDIKINVKLKFITNNDCRANIEITGIKTSLFSTQFYNFIYNNPERWFLRILLCDKIGVQLHEIELNNNNIKHQSKTEKSYLATSLNISEDVFYEIQSFSMQWNGDMYKSVWD